MGFGGRRIIVLVVLCFVSLAVGAPAETFDVKMSVDAGKTVGQLRPIWRYFGYDEPNYTYMKDGKKLLTQIGELGTGPKFIRAHSLLVTGDGTPALKWGSTNAYTEDANGKAIYDWTIIDKIFDTYHERGLKPYVQIGFMPKALSSHPDPYQRYWKPGEPYGNIYGGWSYPPSDYGKWRELCFQWAKHCIERYGTKEVESWYWQVWNECNIRYWAGTAEEYQKLYDYAVDGVRKALPTARVGGPETAGAGGKTEKFIRDFVEHCLRGRNFATGEIGSPLDFLSFHAKGAPKLQDKHVRMGIMNQLATVDDGFRIFSSFPELKGKPIVIGESDPDGCAACSSDLYPQNDYRNGSLYASYTAASFARKHDIADKYDVNFHGAVTWAFEFEDQPWFRGFRALASNGVELPVFNVFRMFAKMPGQRVEASSDAQVDLKTISTQGVRQKPDVGVLASRDEHSLAVFVWHYHDDAVTGPSAKVQINVKGLPTSGKPVTIKQYAIDDEHSNAFTAWKKMGSPQAPTSKQISELESAAKLAEVPSAFSSDKPGQGWLELTLPRQSVALMVFSWE